MGSEIKIKNLYCSYGYENGDEICPIRDFSFDFKPGNIYQVTGDNGAGKSTFLRAFLGIVPIQRGYAEIAPEDDQIESVFSFEIKKLGRHIDSIFYMPQNTLKMFPSNTCVLTYLSYIEHSKGIVSELRNQYNIFSKLLDEIEWRHVNHISGGQRQLLSILVMYATDSQLILLDEPTSDISTKNSQVAIELIQNFISDKKIMIFATHSTDLASITNNKISIG